MLSCLFEGKAKSSIYKQKCFVAESCGRGCSGILCCQTKITIITKIKIISCLQNSSSSKDTAEDPVVAVKNETATSRPKEFLALLGFESWQKSQHKISALQYSLVKKLNLKLLNPILANQQSHSFIQQLQHILFQSQGLVA